MTPADIEELVNMPLVDANPDVHRATESDEEQILTEMYGPPDADGVYRGEGA